MSTCSDYSISSIELLSKIYLCDTIASQIREKRETDV